MREISILGSTGSIGQQTLEVIRANRELFNVVALTGHNNIDLLCEQVEEFRPEYVAINNEKCYEELYQRIGDLCEIGYGEEAIITAASGTGADIVVSAIVGIAGLKPTMAAIENKKTIALANKETLVAGGRIIMNKANELQVKILPVDSEHSAVFQCISNHRAEEISKIILTASGGSFRDKTIEELENVTVADALLHPNWSMGQKVTIDSATMMNKGLEVIEARWLFDIPAENIECVIHKQSIVHSMVEFCDGALIAQLGMPTMKLPIQYALTYPHRLPMLDDKLDITAINNLTFTKPDMNRCKCLQLAYDCLKTSDEACIVLNAANEIVVDLFLNGRIKYLEIPKIIEEVLQFNIKQKAKSIEDVLSIDALARRNAMQIFEKGCKK